MERERYTAAYMRFKKDYNLPINIFTEKYFSYYRALYADFWPFEAERLMWKEISDKGNNVELWLEEYNKFRDMLLEKLKTSEEYIAFRSCDMSKYNFVSPCGERSYYTQETDGKYFISIDLKKANFQALKYVGVISDDTYEDFIKNNGGTEYFANSKYLRQVIFGNISPDRQTKVEKYLMSKIVDIVHLENCELFSLSTDELVYAWKPTRFPEKEFLFSLSNIEREIKEKLNLDVRVEFVHIQRLPIVNPNGATVDAYVRWNLLTGEEKLKKASTTFYPQIYKLWRGEEITDMDKTFYFEGQLATFNEPLIKVKKHD